MTAEPLNPSSDSSDSVVSEPETTPATVVDELLIEEVCIDGMCGVY